MLRIAIIGSAGRGDDAEKLQPFMFSNMVAEAERAAVKIANGRQWCAVSGGAAWADHAAVALFRGGIAHALRLELPAQLTPHGFLETTGQGSPAWLSNKLHRAFSDRVGIDSISELNDAAWRASSSVGWHDGFAVRNRAVAGIADHCIAMTFGQGAQLKRGGTSQTMLAYLRGKPFGTTVHIDLHTLLAHSPAQMPSGPAESEAAS
jgi:hypothetical protein